MNLGILTYSCAENVGAVLQCYALKEFLKSQGHTANVINYQPDYLTDSYGVFHNYLSFSKRNGIYRALTRFRYDLLNYKINSKKYYVFEKFRNDFLDIDNMHIYRTKEEIEKVCSKFDIIITGSDQIWRNIPKINKIDPVFLLDFKKDNKIKTASYAASVGNISDISIENLIKKVKNIDSVSVREFDLKNVLVKNGIENVYCVLDPVFLLEDKKYDTIIKTSDILINEKYIFVYSLQKNDILISLVNKIVNEKYNGNISVIYYSRDKLLFECRKCSKLTVLSPSDFLKYIKYSSETVTNSFHGSAFSLIFNKNFYVVPHNTTGSRMYTLMEKAGLAERIVTEINDVTIKDINWDEVNSRLLKEKKDSIDFLINAI